MLMHADVFAIIPLSQLPPDVLARFGGKVNKNDEELAVMRRKLDNTPVSVPTPQSSAPTPAATAPLPSAQQPQSIRMDEYIASAIANRRLLMIAYDNGAEGPRLVEPHLLGVTTAGHWALSGWFRAGASVSAQGEGWRTYLLEKITAMEMVGQVFDARPDYDPNGGGLYQTISACLPGAVGAAPQAAPPAVAPPVADATLARQQQTAMQYAQTTGQPYEKCLQAVQVWEWCVSHPQGSVVNGVTYDAQATAQQLAMVQQFLNQRPVVQAAPAAAAGGGRMVIESSIDGEFTGFEGEKVFKLLNGQVWQQSDFYYHYSYAYGPRVMIYPANGGWMMKVDGV